MLEVEREASDGSRSRGALDDAVVARLCNDTRPGRPVAERANA